MTARRASLLYPGGAVPGIDWSHPAAQNLRFSAVASGGNFLNLLSGKTGTVTGATAGVRPPVGVTTEFVSATDQVKFAGQTTANDNPITIAAIVFTGTLTGGTTIFSTSDANSGWRLEVNGSQIRLTAGGEANLNGPASLANNTAYFVGASSSSGNTAIVVKELLTGAVATSTGAGTISDAPTGNFVVGNITGAQNWLGGIARVMSAARFTSMPEFLAWSLDPWSFWHPNVGTMRPELFSQGAISSAATTLGMSQGFLFHPGAGPTFELRGRSAFPDAVVLPPPLPAQVGVPMGYLFRPGSGPGNGIVSARNQAFPDSPPGAGGGAFQGKEFFSPVGQLM